MGLLDDVKKALTTKKPEPPAPAERRGPVEARGVSQKTLDLLKKADERPQEKFLGLVIDATASRGPTWDRAQKILRTIFERLTKERGLQVRVVYYGGNTVGDLGWSCDVVGVQRRMAEVTCVAGYTQIAPSLEKFLHESQGHVPENVILIGDAFEETVEQIKPVLTAYRTAKIRIFSFFETGNREDDVSSQAETIFRKIAKVTNGVYQEYREGVDLDALLVAAAAFAAEGMAGLEKLVAENNRAAIALRKELLRIEGKTGG